MTIADLNIDQRMQLIRFICSFAWADFEVKSSERAMVAKIVENLELPLEARTTVRDWLKEPPPLDDIDPTDVPRQHRQVFLDTAWQMISADGAVSREEWESYKLFKELSR